MRESARWFIYYMNMQDINDLACVCDKMQCELEINDGLVRAVIFKEVEK